MAGPDLQRDGDNESRLRKARLASSRSETGAAAQYGPGPIDVDSGIRNVPFVGKAAQRLHERGIVNIPDQPSPFLDAEAAQTRRSAMEQEAARNRAQLSSFADAAMGRNREQGMENQLNRSRRESSEPKAEKEPQGVPAPSIRDATMLAKASPAGAVAGAAMGLASGQLSTADIQRGVGRGCILMLWNSLWLTFGHTIYAIAVLFFIASTSKYARKYFPRVGEEWFPGEMIKRLPKVALIPIKMAEIVGIAFLVFWVFMLDMACIGLFALVLAVIMSAAELLSSFS